jgi:hypothetical protein
MSEEGMSKAAEIYGLIIGLERKLAVAQTHRVKVGNFIFRLHLN